LIAFCTPSLGGSELPILALDSLLHAAVEQDPRQSIQKFIQYNLPLIVKNNQNKPKRIRKRAPKR
jgi:hypothetical protein